MKNHYLLAQISDMVKQLYEWFFLKKNGIKKKQKNIISIAKEVMPAKREMKILSTKKETDAEMEPMNVDNFPNPTENSKLGNLRHPGRI